ncbi:MAG: type IX secretion system membrane protein PorP/SprF [Chitinophagaceae bacterium]|nr:MAG: type IX secretion system membrane protein PorP/SprF [Chitinophagaceae bacterium]
MTKHRNMKKALVTFSILTAALSASAQDAQLSQIFNAPLLLNPAQTGLMDKKWRIAGGYRNTTFSGGSNAFSTGYLSADTRIKLKGVQENDRLGFGLIGYLDQSSAGALRANYIGASLAFNKSLSTTGATRLGIGAQAVYVSRVLNTNKLMFEDQFTSGGFSTLPSRDAARGGYDQHFDLNAGLQLSHDAARWGGSAGFSLRHINKPRESFWGEDYHIPMSYTAHGSAFAKLKGGDKLTLQALYTSFGELNYIQGGLIFSKNIHISTQETTLDVGVLGRDTRTVIPYLGLSYGRTRGAITYDVTTSQSKQAGLSRQSLEIMLTTAF